jgi:hypothetical protein
MFSAARQIKIVYPSVRDHLERIGHGSSGPRSYWIDRSWRVAIRWPSVGIVSIGRSCTGGGKESIVDDGLMTVQLVLAQLNGVSRPAFYRWRELGTEGAKTA